MSVGHLLVFTLVVHPGVQYFLNRQNYPNRRIGIAYATLFFLCVTIGVIWYEQQDSPPNVYETLGVRTDMTDKQIKRRYMELAKTYHPDAQGYRSTVDERHFMILQDAYNVISNKAIRPIYDRFGPSMAANERASETVNNPTHMFFHYVMGYVVLAIIMFLITLDEKRTDSRQYCFLGIFLTMVIEIYVKHSELDFLVFLFPQKTVYEKIELFKNFSSFLLQGVVIGLSHLHVDYKKLKEAKIYELVLRHNYIVTQLRELRQVKQAIKATDAAQEEDELETIEFPPEKNTEIPWGSVVFVLLIAFQVLFRGSSDDDE